MSYATYKFKDLLEDVAVICNKLYKHSYILTPAIMYFNLFLGIFFFIIFLIGAYANE